MHFPSTASSSPSTSTASCSADVMETPIKRVDPVLEEVSFLSSWTLVNRDGIDRKDLAEGMKVLTGFCKAHIEIINKRIMEQLDADIAGPSGMSPNEIKRRQLCRMPLHLKKDDGKEYRPINDVYQDVYNIFTGRSVPPLALKQESEAEKEEKTARMQTAIDEVSVSSLIPSAALPEAQVTSFDPCNLKRLVSKQQRTQMALKAAETDPFPLLPLYIDVTDMKDAFVTEYGHQSTRLLRDGDEIAASVLSHYTVARACDDGCPSMNIEEAAAIYDCFRATASACPSSTDNFEISTLCYSLVGISRSVSEWIETHSPCFQGHRTLVTRFGDRARLVCLLKKCDDYIKNEKWLRMKHLLKLSDLDDSLREQFLGEYAARQPQTHHTQNAITKRFADMRAEFNSSRLVQEDKVCEVCKQLTLSTYIKDRPYEKFRKFLEPSESSTSLGSDDSNCFESTESDSTSSEQDRRRFKNSRKIRKRKDQEKRTIYCCDMCRKAMTHRTHGSLPAAATLNNFQSVPDVPQLSCLNAIERMLIEKARPLQKILFLHSITNKKTKMRAANAVMVVVPTDITSTIDHVVNTLPSESNMIINVRTDWKESSIVRLPKVIAALQFLKANNPLYADITIDTEFSFGLNTSVTFEKNGAAQADADALVCRNSNDEKTYILTQDTVTIQPVKRLNQERGNDSVAKYVLRKNAYQPKKISCESLDLEVFPLKHPFGNDGMHSSRNPRVRLSKYLRTRILNADRSFAVDKKWLSFMFAYKQQLAVTSVQGIMARIPGTTRSGQFDASSEENTKLLTAMFHKMRGYPPYWKSVKLDLRASIATHGPPTWFVTLNPNVAKWTDLHNLYKKVLGREDISSETIESSLDTGGNG
uniref:Helitron_like_N domain-containing protein n=1 Tax=Caenorhabditis japonica TaxID=281687 RepID=A0A8R1I6S5_CAEJA